MRLLHAGDSRLRHRHGQSRRRPVPHGLDGVKYPRWARSRARLPHQRRDQPIDSNLIQRRGDEFVVAVPIVIADNLPVPAGQLYCADNATMREAAGSCDTGRHSRLLHDTGGRPLLLTQSSAALTSYWSRASSSLLRGTRCLRPWPMRGAIGDFAVGRDRPAITVRERRLDGQLSLLRVRPRTRLRAHSVAAQSMRPLIRILR